MGFFFEVSSQCRTLQYTCCPVGAAAPCLCQYVQANKKSVYVGGRAGDGGRFDSTV